MSCHVDNFDSTELVIVDKFKFGSVLSIGLQ